MSFPALFRSLFYEACGRIVNPVYGAVGLLCSGNWQACQDAAEMVLNGKTLKPLSSSPSQISHDPSATRTNHHPFSTPPLETLLRTFDQTNHLDKIDHSSFAIAPMRTTTSVRDRLHELSESKPRKSDHQTDLLVERSDSLPLPKKPLKRKAIQCPADHPHPSPARVAPLCEAIYRAGLEGGSASAVVLDLTLSSYPIASAATAAAHSKRRHKQLCTTKMAAPGSNSVSSEGSVTSLDQTPALTIFQPGSFLPPNP